MSIIEKRRWVLHIRGFVPFPVREELGKRFVDLKVEYGTMEFIATRQEFSDFYRERMRDHTYYKIIGEEDFPITEQHAETGTDRG